MNGTINPGIKPLSLELCRACLVSNEPLIPFDDSFLINFNLLTNLNVSLNDSLPKYCCQSCVDAVRFFMQFRQKCTTSEKTLRASFEKSKFDDDLPLSELLDNKHAIEIKKEHVVDPCHNDAEDYPDFSFDFDGQCNIKKEELKDNDSAVSITTIQNNKKRASKVKKRGCKIEISSTKSSRLKQTIKRNGARVKSTDLDKPFKRRDKRKGQGTKKKNVVINSSGSSENTSLLCGICVKDGFDESNLKVHLETHKAAKQCELCSENIWSWPQLLGHRVVHLPKEQQKCHLCSRCSRSAFYLEYHYLKSHNEGDEIALKCNICWRSYSSARKLTRHIWSSHSEPKFKCDYCSKVYTTKTILAKHMLNHMEEKTFKCDLCPFACKTGNGLRSHKIYKHTPAKVSCKPCGRVFSNQEKYDKHTCKSKSVICPICGKSLSHSYRLAKHLDSHKAVSKYKCHRCPAAYRTSSGLKMHINQHDGIRKYKCEYCPAKFFYASVLIKHRRIHTGEKPYVCEICTKSFTGNHNLKVHMRIHGLFVINKKNKDEEEVININ